MKKSKLGEEIASLQAVLEVSSDPTQRARDRMNDAEGRGGFQGMIDATLRRIEATKDYSKLIGIRRAVEQKIQTVAAGSSPGRVRQLEQLLTVLKSKMGR